MTNSGSICFMVLSDGIGGAETVVKNLIAARNGSREIYLIVNQEIEYFYQDVIDKNNILSIGSLFLKENILFPNFIKKMYSIFKVKKNIDKIEDFIKKVNAASVVSTLMLDLYALSQLECFFVRKYAAVHGLIGIDPTLQKFIFNSEQSKKFLLKMDGIICVSELIFRYFKENYKNINSYYIDNGVDKYDGVVEHKVSNDGVKSFLFCGGSKEVKGSSLLYSAISSLLSEGVNFKISIAGSLDQKSQWYRLQKTYPENVFILGYVEHRLLQNLIIDSDCVLMPSVSEGGMPPLLAKEALTLKTPVIASDIEAFEYSIPSPYRTQLNVSQLKEKIWLFISSEEYRLGFTFDYEGDSWDDVFVKYLDILS